MSALNIFEYTNNPLTSSDPAIKVAFISWHLVKDEKPRDGVAVYNVNILSELRKLGVEVYEIWREKSGIKGLWPFYNVMALYKVSKLIKKNKINIVHGSNADGFLASIYKEIPYVHTLHPVIASELDITGELMHALTKKRFHKFIVYKSLIYAEVIAVTNADVIIAPSEFTKNEAVRYYKISPKKVVVIPHGVNIEEFERFSPFSKTIMRKDSLRTRILFVGRLVRRKGLIYLIRACELLNKHYNIELRVVGNGPERKRLESYCKMKGLDFVKFLGDLPRKKVIEEYLSCDIFCLPSLHEAFGIVLLEAMAAKKPVVATRVGGIPEVVVDGETGALVPPRDVEALAEALEKLIVDEGLRYRMGMKGYERARYFTWKRAAKRLKEIYGSLLQFRHKGITHL